MNRSLTLVRANLVLVALLVLHDLDHVRQGRSIALPVIAVGLVGLLATIGCLVLAAVGHPLAPQVSLLVGVGNVVGFAAIHILPRWSVLSDPYPDVPVDAISWLGLAATMFVAFMVGLIGVNAIRHRQSGVT
ncbi:MAG: hypothetical protein ABIS18_09950 [Actinomycetota bacterium]